MPALLFAAWAQAQVSGAYNRYSRVRVSRGMTGAMAARRILDDNGLTGVRVERVAGKLSDHYDPGERVVRLSAGVYDSDSVASLGVAAHECGHAVQHATHYAPLTFRNAIDRLLEVDVAVPVAPVAVEDMPADVRVPLAGVPLVAAHAAFERGGRHHQLEGRTHVILREGAVDERAVGVLQACREVVRVVGRHRDGCLDVARGDVHHHRRALFDPLHRPLGDRSGRLRR